MTGLAAVTLTCVQSVKPDGLLLTELLSPLWREGWHTVGVAELEAALVSLVEEGDIRLGYDRRRRR